MSPFRYNKIYNFNQKAFEASVIFACFSIFFPTFFLSASLVFIIIFWVLSGNLNLKLSIIKKNKSALAATGLFFLYVVGVLYSSAQFNESLHYLEKYLKLLLIPILVSGLRDENIANKCMNAFILGAIFILALSYMKLFKLIPAQSYLPQFHFQDYFSGEAHGYLIFKNRITHGFLMSFLMYVGLIKAFFSKGKKLFLWGFLSILCFFNSMYMCPGRTGQITSVLLLFYFFFEIKALSKFKIITKNNFYIYLSFIAILFFASFKNFEAFVPERMLILPEEIVNYYKYSEISSAGERLEMSIESFKIINKSIFFGHGTGSLDFEHSKIDVKSFTFNKLDNPHNQFILTTVELGIIGLFLFLLMIQYHYNDAKLLVRFNGQAKYYLRGIVFTFALGCLFNSLLLDATEGRFYCLIVGVLLSLNPATKNRSPELR
jgi:O-antigen ligase